MTTILHPTTTTTARATVDALPGGHLVGKFELRDAVSRSASGIVYRAWDRDLGLAVAVKEHLPTPLARRESGGDVAAAAAKQADAYAASLQAFIRATRALAHCDHHALVRVLQLQFAHGTAYRVMPWVDGEPLLEARRRLPEPPDERALRELLDDLLGALEAFHHTGNVHGGVQPSQVLLRRDERVLLLGPADVVSAAAEQGAAGTSADLRGVAEVARFWIGGALPANEWQRVEPTAQIVERLSADTDGPRYGAAFMSAIDAAISPDTTQRPRTAAEFRDRLAESGRADARSVALVPLVVEEVSPFQGLDLIAEDPPETFGRPEPFGTPEMYETPWQPPLPDDRYHPPVEPRRRGGWRVVASATIAAAVLVAVGFGVQQSLEPSVPRAVASVEPVEPALPAPAPASAVAPPAAAAVPPAAEPPAPLPPPVVTSPALPPPAVTAAAAPAAEPAAPPVKQAATPPAPVKPAATTTPPPVKPAVAAPVKQAAAAPVKPAAAPAKQRSAPTKQADAPTRLAGNPRDACGERSEFSLYRCMQQQCKRPAWLRHPQCVRLRVSDRVD